MRSCWRASAGMGTPRSGDRRQRLEIERVEAGSHLLDECGEFGMRPGDRLDMGLDPADVAGADEAFDFREIALRIERKRGRNGADETRPGLCAVRCRGAGPFERQLARDDVERSEEHTSELQYLMRI